MPAANTEIVHHCLSFQPTYSFRSLPSLAMFAKSFFSFVFIAHAFAAPASQGMTISNTAQQKAVQMCGAAQSVVLTDTPWIVYNMFYNQAQTKGSMCTGYDSVSTGSDGNKKIKWSAVTNIEYVKAT